MKNSPLVSVIMPVFNSEKYLSQAIESILNQSFSEFEFLIFDDGSNDASPDIINRYANQDSRIVPYYSESNVGYVAHLNNGIRITKSCFIARMDSDDISMPDRLKFQKDFLEKNPLVGVVGSSSICIDRDGKELGVSKRQIAASYLYWQSFFTNPLAHPTVMYRKAVFNLVEGYDLDKMPAEDYDLWTRLLDTWYLANIEEPLLKYREHDNSVSFRKRELQFKNSSDSLATLWQRRLILDISYDELLFLKMFHKGYDNLPPPAAYPLFNKIIALKKLVQLKFPNVDRQVHFDFFRRCLYLASRSRSHSYHQVIEIMFYLLMHYPLFTIRYFIYGKI